MDILNFLAKSSGSFHVPFYDSIQVLLTGFGKFELIAYRIWNEPFYGDGAAAKGFLHVKYVAVK